MQFIAIKYLTVIGLFCYNLMNISGTFIAMKKDKTSQSSLIDPNLNPQNAMKKGYTYIDDVIYDQQSPSDAMIHILELSQEFNCKLGAPQCSLTLDPYFGLYVPRKVI